MGKGARIIFSIFALAVLSPFLAMLFEPFFSEVLSLLGVDSSQWAGPVVTLVAYLAYADWFRLVAAFVVGVAIGAWLHWLATRFDRMREPKKPPGLVFDYTKGIDVDDVPPAPKEPIPDNWTDAYRGRDILRLHEAASLLSGVHSSRSDTDPRYNGKLEQIKLAILEGEMHHEFGQPPPLKSIEASVQGEEVWERWRESKVTPESRIYRDDLVHYLELKEDHEGLKRLGL